MRLQGNTQYVKLFPSSHKSEVQNWNSDASICQMIEQESQACILCAGGGGGEGGVEADETAMYNVKIGILPFFVCPQRVTA